MKAKNGNSETKPEEKGLKDMNAGKFSSEGGKKELLVKAVEKTRLEELAELEPKDGVFAVQKEFITPDGELDFEKVKKHTEEAKRKFKERRQSAEEGSPDSRN